MKRRRKPDHSVDDEPQFSGQPFAEDAAEERAESLLRSEEQLEDAQERRARHSVYDEPATQPGRAARLIERDWPCDGCGYNLRGLMTEHPCPECGQVSHYLPPPSDEMTYADYLASHGGTPTVLALGLMMAGLLVATFMLGIYNAFMLVELTGPLIFVVMGPAMSEFVRIAPTWVAVERYWYLSVDNRSVMYMALSTSLVFAFIQNGVYLTVYFPNSPDWLILYRWTVGVAMHLLCGWITATGLCLVRQQAVEARQTPRMGEARRRMALAIGIHGAFNALVFFTGQTGLGF